MAQKCQQKLVLLLLFSFAYHLSVSQDVPIGWSIVGFLNSSFAHWFYGEDLQRSSEYRWFPVFVRGHNVKVPAAIQLWILSLVLRQSETLEMNNADFCPIKNPRHFSPHNIVFKVNLTLAVKFSHALRYQLFVSRGHGRFLTDVWFRHIHKVPEAPAEPKQRSVGKVSPYLLSYTDISLSITKPFKTKSNQ